jgi:hypothetical protein
VKGSGRGRLAVPALLLAACAGTGPASPSVQLNLLEGPQFVSFLGSAISPDPRVKLCTPIGSPREGTFATGEVVLARVGDEWIGRSRPGEGTLELRLRADGADTNVGPHVVGSVTGWADTADPLGPKRSVRVTFQGGVSLEGSSSRSAYFVEGDATGTVLFSDPSGSIGTCPQVDWTLQPTSGPLPPGIIRAYRPSN